MKPPTTNPPNVNDYLIGRLKQLGVTHMFTVAGDYNDTLLGQLDSDTSDNRIVRYGCTNELEAAFAASGYAKAQKKIGVLNTTYGPGSFSALNGVAGGTVERVPILFTNGSPNVRNTLLMRDERIVSHHVVYGEFSLDLSVFRPITCRAERIENPELAPAIIDSVLQACVTLRQPAYLEIPRNIGTMPCAPCPSQPIKIADYPSDASYAAMAAQAVVDALNKSKRPLIFAGAEIRRFGVEKLFSQFLKKTGLPYATDMLGKSILNEVEFSKQFVGTYTGKCSAPYTIDVFQNQQCDLLLVLGVWMADLDLFGTAKPTQPMNLQYASSALQNTIVAANETVRYQYFCASDVSLKTLLELLLSPQYFDQIKQAWELKDFPKTPVKPYYEFPVNYKPEDILTYDGLFGHLTKTGFLNDTDKVFMTDACFAIWSSLQIPGIAADNFVLGNVWGSIGYSMGEIIGVKAFHGDKKRSVVFVGDGCFQELPGTISTMARYKHNTVLFVLDNRSYGVEQWLVDANGFTNSGTFTGPNELVGFKKEEVGWKYAKLAKALNGRGRRCETHADLDEALQQIAATKDTFYLVQVVLPLKDVPGLCKWKVPASTK